MHPVDSPAVTPTQPLRHDSNQHGRTTLAAVLNVLGGIVGAALGSTL